MYFFFFTKYAFFLHENLAIIKTWVYTSQKTYNKTSGKICDNTCDKIHKNTCNNVIFQNMIKYTY